MATNILKQTSNYSRQARGVNLYYVDLNVFRETVLVQVHHKVMDKVKPGEGQVKLYAQKTSFKTEKITAKDMYILITDDDERELVREFSLLQEVLHSLWIVTTALSADPLYFLQLTSLTGGLRRSQINYCQFDIC